MMKSAELNALTPEQTLRDALKGATNDYHNCLNQHSLLAGLLRPDYSLHYYRQLLTAYHHLYRTLESRLIAFQDSQPDQFDYAQRVKLPWICRDLEFFGIDRHGREHAVAQIQPVPAITSIGAYVGMLYVIEGSMLGGQIIARSLAKHHGLSRETGACFYHGYGGETVIMWQTFLRFAETLAGDLRESLVAEQAACQTFQVFINVLDAYAYS
jgi:heme oxygenase